MKLNQLIEAQYRGKTNYQNEMKKGDTFRVFVHYPIDYYFMEDRRIDRTLEDILSKYDGEWGGSGAGLGQRDVDFNVPASALDPFVKEVMQLFHKELPKSVFENPNEYDVNWQHQSEDEEDE